MNFRPLHDRVVVRRIEAAHKGTRRANGTANEVPAAGSSSQKQDIV